MGSSKGQISLCEQGDQPVNPITYKIQCHLRLFIHPANLHSGVCLKQIC
jgi:hypothetical protein